jgi:hypothetical protein
MMTWTWLALAALGAGHGLNPGMGWLFAVALGMQERRGGAVWRALPPLALGHALAVGVAVAAAVALGGLLPAGVLEWGVGGLLLGLGMLRLLRHRHPRYGGMRVGFRELTIWSFLMATAHGAGLMVLPLLVGDHGVGAGQGQHAMQMARASLLPESGALLATGMHSAGYLLVTGLIAVVVYHRLGLGMLRTLWLNLDLVWGGALVLTGVLTIAL